MKGHPPIKRHQAMLSFSKDHHSGLLLVWKIKQGLDKSIDTRRVGDYVLFFYKEELESHFKDEERLLFSKLPHGDVLRKQAESDHQDISQLFAALGKNIKDADLLYEIANKLEQHIRFEERELFNHLQNILSQEELEDVAARPANNSNAPEEAWKDKFWIK